MAWFFSGKRKSRGPDEPNAARRRFFKDLIGETANVVDAFQGKPKRKEKHKLRYLPEEILLQMVPVLDEDVYVAPDGFTLKKKSAGEEDATLLVLSEKDRFVVEKFNGENTVAGVGKMIQEAFEENRLAAAIHAKSIFIILSELSVAKPLKPGSLAD